MERLFVGMDSFWILLGFYVITTRLVVTNGFSLLRRPEVYKDAISLARTDLFVRTFRFENVAVTDLM